MGLFSNHLLYFCTPSRIIWWLPSVGRALEKRGCCCPVAAPRWAVQAWCALTAANQRGFGNWCWETGSIGLAPTWELTHSSPPYKSCTLHPKCVFSSEKPLSFKPQIIFTCSSKNNLTVAFSLTRYKFSISIYVLLHWSKRLWIHRIICSLQRARVERVINTGLA